MKKKESGAIGEKPASEPAPLLAGPIARTWSPADREALRLTDWANKLEGLWWNARPEDRRRFIDGRPLRDLVLDDSERMDIAACLRRLAANPVALKAYAGRPKRGNPGAYTKAFRVALDYLATCERLGKSEAAIAEMQDAWKPMSRATILRHYEVSILKASRRPGRNYTRDPVTIELARIDRENPNLTREELLKAVSAELRKTPSR
jgi:hypothetical protein